MGLTKTDTTVTNIPDISKSIRDDMSIDGTRLYIDTQLATKSDETHIHSTYALLDSPDFIGTPTAPTPGNTNNSTRIATTAWVRTHTGNTYLPLAGGSLTNFLTLHADPTNNMHAATKRYVDNNAGGVGSGQSWINYSIYNVSGGAVTGPRVPNTNYQNTTGKPISLQIYGAQEIGGDGAFIPVSVSVGETTGTYTIFGYGTVFTVVPPEWYYRVNYSGTSTFAITWFELR